MKVDLVSKTVGQGIYSELSSDEIISATARHGAIKKDNGKLIKYLMDNKHWSPLQFISFGFKIHTSRMISAQIMRHRSLNFQEWSQRYSESMNFENLDIRVEHETNRQSSRDSIAAITQMSLHSRSTFVPEVDDYEITEAQKDAVVSACEALTDIHAAYKKMIDSGIAKECARGILPMSTKTIIHVSGTLRDLLAFLNVRCDHHTQKEAQDIAQEMGRLIEDELPSLMSRIEWEKGLFL